MYSDNFTGLVKIDKDVLKGLIATKRENVKNLYRLKEEQDAKDLKNVLVWSWLKFKMVHLSDDEQKARRISYHENLWFHNGRLGKLELVLKSNSLEFFVSFDTIAYLNR